MAMRLINPAELKKSLLSIPLLILILVVISVFLSQLLSSYRWWLLARSGGISVPWSLAFKLWLTGLGFMSLGKRCSIRSL
jgi:hypothetical protein